VRGGADVAGLASEGLAKAIIGRASAAISGRVRAREVRTPGIKGATDRPVSPD